MTRNWARALVAVLMVLAGSIIVSSPANASGVTSVAVVDLAFIGNARLPTFPCPPPPPFGTGPCSGNFSGSWGGHAEGTYGSSPWQVYFNTVPQGSGLSASFFYNEFNCFVGIETLAGTAQGTGTALAGAGQVKGNYQVVGETVPRDIVAVSLSFSFEWTRVGNSAFITLNPTTFRIHVNGIATPIAVVNSSQVAEATFVPTDVHGAPVPSCSTPAEVRGTIAGQATFTQGTI